MTQTTTETERTLEEYRKALALCEADCRAANSRAADYAEIILSLIKAAESAKAWIGEAVEGAKALDTTIDVIPTDHKTPFWSRTTRVRRQLNDALRRASGALAP